MIFLRLAVALALFASYICADYSDGSWIERVMVWDDASGEVVYCLRTVGPGPGGSCMACQNPQALPCAADPTLLHDTLTYVENP